METENSKGPRTDIDTDILYHTGTCGSLLIVLGTTLSSMTLYNI